MIKFLSYTLDKNTPTYGSMSKFEVFKSSSIKNGDTANNTLINTTVHIGTHIDLPYHFYENGQTICNFDDDFWVFKNIIIVDIEPRSLIIKDELIEKLKDIDCAECDLLIVKTGSCNFRCNESYWNSNYGFSPSLYDFLINKMPKLRVFGFDSISISSFKHRDIGRQAHKQFLNPIRPILLLEDMDLNFVNEKTIINQIVLAPLRINKCDGLPCSVIGFIDD